MSNKTGCFNKKCKILFGAFVFIINKTKRKTNNYTYNNKIKQVAEKETVYVISVITIN